MCVCVSFYHTSQYFPQEKKHGIQPSTLIPTMFAKVVSIGWFQKIFTSQMGLESSPSTEQTGCLGFQDWMIFSMISGKWIWCSSVSWKNRPRLPPFLLPTLRALRGKPAAPEKKWKNNKWLVVEPPLWNEKYRQIGNLPQIGVKRKKMFETTP